jgi:hypothetical protein
VARPPCGCGCRKSADCSQPQYQLASTTPHVRGRRLWTSCCSVCLWAHTLWVLTGPGSPLGIPGLSLGVPMAGSAAAAALARDPLAPPASSGAIPGRDAHAAPGGLPLLHGPAQPAHPRRSREDQEPGPPALCHAAGRRHRGPPSAALPLGMGPPADATEARARASRPHGHPVSVATTAGEGHRPRDGARSHRERAVGQVRCSHRREPGQGPPRDTAGPAEAPTAGRAPRSLGGGGAPCRPGFGTRRP